MTQTYGPFVPAGTIVPLPPLAPSDSSTTLLVVTEKDACLPICWRPEKMGIPSMLATAPDGYANIPIQDPGLATAAQIMVGYSTTRFGICRSFSGSVSFPPQPHAMNPVDLVQQFTNNGNFAAGFDPHRDVQAINNPF